MRATYANSVDIISREDGTFHVKVAWVDKHGVAGEHISEFPLSRIFGETTVLPEYSWAIARKAYDHSREVIREVLTVRGALL